MHPLKPLILCCLLINWGSIKAQDPGSHGRKLSVLSLQYQQHKLEDTEYMKAVDSIAPLLLQNDSLPQRLSVYRQVVDLADPASASFVIPGGASGDPASPHFADQFALWAEHRRIGMTGSAGPAGATGPAGS